MLFGGGRGDAHVSLHLDETETVEKGANRPDDPGAPDESIDQYQISYRPGLRFRRAASL